MLLKKKSYTSPLKAKQIQNSAKKKQIIEVDEGSDNEGEVDRNNYQIQIF